MKALIAVTVLMNIFLNSCAALPELKMRPEYQGVDSRAQRYVDEYMSLSSGNHLIFYNKVTLGFKNIKTPNVLGMCTFGRNWREIDIDIDFWNNANEFEKIAVVFHELTHCYCGRDHDYAENKRYATAEAERMKEAMDSSKVRGPKPGRFEEDSCPVSLMYPIVINRECLMAHHNQYIQEMFDRCQPW